MTALQLLIAVCPMMAEQAHPISVDGKKQLFLDDYVIASTDNIKLTNEA